MPDIETARAHLQQIQSHATGALEALQDGGEPPTRALAKAYVENPRRPQGDELRAWVAEQTDIDVLPAVRDQYGSAERRQSADWASPLTPEQIQSLHREIDEAEIPQRAPLVFFDMEKSDKAFENGNDQDRQNIALYSKRVFSASKDYRRDLESTRFIRWKAPQQKHKAAQMDDEWRRRQSMWSPVIQDAGAVGARLFPNYGSVQQDLEWMVPYVTFCLELADGLPVIPTAIALKKPASATIELADSAYLMGIWKPISEIRVNGRGVTAFDFFASYKVTGGGQAEGAELNRRNEHYKWALTALADLIG